MSSFVDLTGVPREASPSLAQWKRLITACSGCLCHSSFAAVVFEFCSYSGSTPGLDDTSDPQEIAEAMIAMSKVSSGLLDSVTFTGGPSCGWLGAVAQWLLGLSVVVENDAGIIYRGCFVKRGEKAHVRILYDRFANQPPSTSVAIRKSWRLGKVSNIIQEQHHRGLLQLCIRVPWASALSATFGPKPVGILTQDLATVFSTGLGSAACIFDHIVRASPGVDEDILRSNQYYLDAAYGRTFLRMTASRLPEIPEKAVDNAMNYVNNSYNDACMAYESALTRLAATCACPDHRAEAGISIVSSEDPGLHSPICITALFDTIVRISRGTSNQDTIENLCPSQSGLFNIYETFRNRGDWEPLKRLLGDTDPSPIAFATTLYCGHPPPSLFQELGDKVSAIMHRGLCFYMDALCNIDTPHVLLRIHIMSGSIELDNRPYSLVLDGPFEGPQYPARQLYLATDNLQHPQPKLPNDMTAIAVATEAESHISFVYKITSPRGSSWIPPAELALAAARATGNIKCSRQRKCPQLIQAPQAMMVCGEGIVQTAQPAYIRLRLVSETGPAWCVALMDALRGGARGRISTAGQGWRNKYRVLLKDGQCMACSVRTAMCVDRTELIYTNSGDNQSRFLTP